MLLQRTWIVFLVAASLISLAACKKSQSGPTTFTLPGAPQVIAALDSKDYPGAVQALAQVKVSLTDEQRLEYNQLSAKVKETMVQAMATNATAAQAYQALRFLEAGR